MASKFLGIFGGKQAPGGPALAVSSVPPPPTAPQNTPSEVLTGGRRRVTQRLVLGGKGSTGGAPETGRIKLPGALQAESTAPEIGAVDGVAEVPVYVLLRCFPVEFLNADVDALSNDPAAQESAALPLSSILPQLPSGKVEFAAADLAAYLPVGWVKSASEMGEYSGYGILIPLPELIQRIHPDYLSLRNDQKPVDAGVIQMTDPFTPEQLMEAQAKALAAASGKAAVPEPAAEVPPESEPAAAWEPGPEPEETPQPGPEADWQAPAEEQAVVETAAEEFAGAGLEMPPEETPTLPQPEPAEADLSFTQSEAFQAFLKQMQAEEADGPQAEAPAEAPVEEMPAVETSVDESGAPAEIPAPPAQDYELPEELPTQVMDQQMVPWADSQESPEFAPTRPLDILPQPETEEPVPAPVKPPATARPTFSLKVASAPTPETQAMTVAPAPVTGKVPVDQTMGTHSSIRFSRTLALRLRYQPEEVVSLRELLHRMSTWPGMKGCILGGRDGLTISADTQDTRSANTISAFAPKIMGRVSELFRDLGYEDINELQTTTRDGSVFIFRQADLFFISLFDGNSLPASYRELIGQTLEELSRWHHSKT